MLRKGSFLRELPVIVVAALIVSILVKTFLIHFFYIPSGSMENTLQVGDRIAVNKFGALFTDIKRGEVVVFADPDNWLGSSDNSGNSGISGVIKTGLITVGVLPDPAKQFLIKRVVGVGGDNVTCCDKSGKLQVNGVSIASADSRFHPNSANNGMVPMSKVVGRAVFIVWPVTNLGFIPKGNDLKKIPVKPLP